MLRVGDSHLRMSFLFLHHMVGYQLVLHEWLIECFAGIWDTGSRKFQGESLRGASSYKSHRRQHFISIPTYSSTSYDFPFATMRIPVVIEHSSSQYLLRKWRSFLQDMLQAARAVTVSWDVGLFSNLPDSRNLLFSELYICRAHVLFQILGGIVTHS